MLSYQETSEWASPSFIIPKKLNRVRWISDLRALHKVIKQTQYPLPLINDILRKITGCSFFTKLDISMQYYTFELTEQAKEMCRIITPFGKFQYNVIPMGVKQSPDFAQEVMEDVFHDFQDVKVYVDDIGLWLKDDHHAE